MTVDERGGQAVAPIIELGSTVAPPGHQLVRLILVDGRLLRVSPGHPTFDGRTVADLKVGTPYDGAIIASVDLEPYGGGHTFDILPAGPTGQYWANAIRMGSTLRK